MLALWNLQWTALAQQFPTQTSTSNKEMQQTCVLWMQQIIEEVILEIFGARITEFGVVVGKIWGFEVWWAFFLDFSRARYISRIIFEKPRVWLGNSRLRVDYPIMDHSRAHGPPWTGGGADIGSPAALPRYWANSSGFLHSGQSLPTWLVVWHMKHTFGALHSILKWPHLAQLKQVTFPCFSSSSTFLSSVCYCGAIADLSASHLCLFYAPNGLGP
jgi:hypothetical protein